MRALLVFISLSIFFSVCERPPVQKDLPSSQTAPGQNTAGHSKMGHSPMPSSPNAASAAYELQFIDTMIAHHQGAIDMAQLAPTRAGHQELKRLAAKIVADQQSQIAQMRAWREQYFKDAVPAINMELPGMRQGMQEMDIAKLDMLKERPFDLEFMRQMTAHHEGAATMAGDALGRLERSASEVSQELRSFAQRIVETQQAEIAQMKQWETAWRR